MSLDERFDEAAKKVKDLKTRPTDEELLELYALFKQGSVGDNETTGEDDEGKPGLLDLKGKYKWEAWNKQKGKPKDQAKEEYIKFAESLIAKYS